MPDVSPKRLTVCASRSATQRSSSTRTIALGPDPTRTGLAASAPEAAVSRETVPPRPFATQTEPPSTSKAFGPSPTPTAASAWPVPASIRCTVLSPAVGDPHAALARGDRGRPDPTLIACCTTRFAGMLIRVTVSSARLATQRSSRVATSAAGLSPTWKVWVTRRVAGSTRITVSSLWFATQSEPPP